MLYIHTHEPLTLALAFEVDGEFVTPDSGSVRYTVRGHDGQPLAGATDVVVAAPGTGVSLALPSWIHTRTRPVEKRSVVLTFIHAGQQHTVTRHYRVVDWLPMTASAADVRAYLGLSAAELPDDGVDLVEAYLAVAAAVGGEALAAALQAGTRQELVANRAIVYRAALDLLPALAFRVIASERSDAVAMSRLARLDAAALARDTAALYAEALAALTGAGAEVVGFLVTTPTDPVTG